MFPKEKECSSAATAEQSRNTGTVMSAEVLPGIDMQKTRTVDKKGRKAGWNKQIYSFRLKKKLPRSAD